MLRKYRDETGKGVRREDRRGEAGGRERCAVSRCCLVSIYKGWRKDGRGKRNKRQKPMRSEVSN